ncbi:MAG: hypothetical protein P8X74_00645 [Reinekea sp.]
MFHFRRSTLWIIIYITIPLVAVLNAIGPKNDTPEYKPELDVIDIWSLDQVEFGCEGRLCQLSLPGAKQFRFSILLDRVPTRSVPVPDNVSLSVSRQGGYFIVSVSATAQASAIDGVSDFLETFLPALGESKMVLSADKTMHGIDRLVKAVDEAQGDSVDNKVSQPSALTRLAAPSFGHPDQLPFLLWVEVLKQRLPGYQIEVRWDHRQATSYVLINTTVANELYAPVSEQEFATVHEAYQKAAAQRMRSASQLHRYAVTASVYQLPFEYFVRQPERLDRIRLADVEQMREFSLEQIQKQQQAH